MRKFRPRTLGSICMTLLVYAVSAVPVGAQAGVVDEGTFDIAVGGRSAGSEEFSIRQTGTGSAAETVATGRINLSLSSGTLELVPRLRTSGVQANPVAYEVSVGGDTPRRIVGSIGGGRVSTKVVSASGEQLREYVASSGAVVLDEPIAHQYYFLAQRVRNGQVPVINPRENRQVMAAVREVGEEQLSVGGETATVYRLLVQPEGAAERSVWVDALNRVIKLEIPEQRYVATRRTLPR